MHLTILRQRMPQSLHLGPQRFHFPIRGRFVIPVPAPVTHPYPLPMTRPIPVACGCNIWVVSCPQRRRWQSAGKTVRGAALPQCATYHVRVSSRR